MIECTCPWMKPGHTAMGWAIGCKCEAMKAEHASKAVKEKPAVETKLTNTLSAYYAAIIKKSIIYGNYSRAGKSAHMRSTTTHFADNEPWRKLTNTNKGWETNRVTTNQVVDRKVDKFRCLACDYVININPAISNDNHICKPKP